MWTGATLLKLLVSLPMLHQLRTRLQEPNGLEISQAWAFELAILARLKPWQRNQMCADQEEEEEEDEVKVEDLE